jgi:hypothetical protein
VRSFGVCSSNGPRGYFVLRRLLHPVITSRTSGHLLRSLLNGRGPAHPHAAYLYSSSPITRQTHGGDRRTTEPTAACIRLWVGRRTRSPRVV